MKGENLMRSLILPVLVMALALNITGCGGYFITPMVGATIRTNAKFPVTATTAQGSKKGKACVMNYLGLIEKGDASIEAAKENGGITAVATVDSQVKSLLFFYGEYCTIVTGN